MLLILSTRREAFTSFLESIHCVSLRGQFDLSGIGNGEKRIKGQALFLQYCSR